MSSPLLLVIKSRSIRRSRRPDFWAMLMPNDFFTPLMVEELNKASFNARGGDFLIRISIAKKIIVFYRNGRPVTDTDIIKAFKEDERAELADDALEQVMMAIEARVDHIDEIRDSIWDEIDDIIESERDSNGRLSRRAQDRLRNRLLLIRRPEVGIEVLAKLAITKITGRATRGHYAYVPLCEIPTNRGLVYLTYDSSEDGEDHRFIAYQSHLLHRLAERDLGQPGLPRDLMQAHLLLKLAVNPKNVIYLSKESRRSLWFVPGGVLLGSFMVDPISALYFSTYVSDDQLTEEQCSLRQQAKPFSLRFWQPLPTSADVRQHRSSKYTPGINVY